jgi:hypothetical protein
VADQHDRVGPAGVDAVVGEDVVPVLVEPDQVVERLAHAGVDLGCRHPCVAVALRDLDVGLLQLDDAQRAVRAEQGDVHLVALDEPPAARLAEAATTEDPQLVPHRAVDPVLRRPRFLDDRPQLGRPLVAALQLRCPEQDLTVLRGGEHGHRLGVHDEVERVSGTADAAAHRLPGRGRARPGWPGRV